MNRSLFFHWIAGFILIVSLVGCNAVMSRVMPERGAFTGPTGEGTVGSAYWVGHKCQAILAWLNDFKKDYPGVEISYQPGLYGNLPVIANLFRDSAFVPVFGFAYNDDHREELNEINHDIIAGCMGHRKYRTMAYREEFGPLKLFFDNTFARVQPQLVAAVRDLNAREAWLAKTNSEIENIPHTQEGFERLTNHIIPEGTRQIGPLRPRDLESFRAVTREKQKAIARDVLDNDFPGIESLPPTQETVATFNKAYPYVEVLLPDGSVRAQIMAAKRKEILGNDLASFVKRLAAIPLTLEGRQQSVDWLRSFEAAFKDRHDDWEVTNISRTWVDKREAIFQATRDDFLEKLEKIPYGPDSKPEHDKLLAETFPLERDKVLNAYQYYLVETLDRQKPLWERAYDKTRKTIRGVGQGISDAAKDIIHGDDQ